MTTSALKSGNKNRNIIIFVNAIRPATFQALKDYEQQSGRKFTPIVFVDQKVKESIFECNDQYNLPEKVEVITADFDSPKSIRKAIAPIMDRIYAVTAQYENCIEELQKLVPYFPHIPVPTERSLVWSTEKKLMREMLESYDEKLVPGYMQVEDGDDKTIRNIESTLPYPVVVKPSALQGSLLVSYVDGQEQLRSTLKNTFELTQQIYDNRVKRQKPKVLVEEFMVGKMYTIDVYVDAEGACYCLPTVGAVVAQEAGYDDLFCHKVFLPSGLDEAETKLSQEAAIAACHALGLRSTTAHVEMMRTETGWKIIELGPRIGGYRHGLYEAAYGANHIMNDILNRANEEPVIPTNVKNHSLVSIIYAHEEGTLKAVHGIEETKQLASLAYIHQNLFPGDRVAFAKNGGDLIIDVMLSHPDKAQLEADIAAMESAIVFDVEPIAQV